MTQSIWPIWGLRFLCILGFVCLSPLQAFPQSDTSEATSPASFGKISLTVTPEVKKNIRYFYTVIPERFQQYLSRFYKYEPMVTKVFEEFGLPHELKYLSLVESGFNPRAYSRARAAGPWQFMKATGRLYGLRYNYWIDERRDPMKSTVAAAHHLRDLYDQFGSWPLALAAYNAGAGKIQRAIQKSQSRDYWKIASPHAKWYRIRRGDSLSKIANKFGTTVGKLKKLNKISGSLIRAGKKLQISHQYLRRETREYVPRFIAATIIATNPTLYGFKARSSEVHQYEEMNLKKTVHLKSVAKETGVSFEDLNRLNPELRRKVVPILKHGYYLKVPIGMTGKIESVLDQIKVWGQPSTQNTWYRVRRGDSLSVIANRFGISLQKLKALNNLSKNLIRVEDRLRTREEPPLPRDGVKLYRVQPGDSLWSIAKQFRITVRDLMALNQLQGSLIHAGRVLLVRRT